MRNLFGSIKNKVKYLSLVLGLIWVFAYAVMVPFTFAEEDSRATISPPTETATPASIPGENDSNGLRNFYNVLEDLLGDFEFDLKNGDVSGLKNLSIKNIITSENIPPSFKSHLELLMTEKILKHSKTHMIQCLPCKARKTSLNGDQVVITSPDTNQEELARIAKMSNIEHFLDATFLYQPTGMILSMYITDPESQSIIWSKSYNSETSRSSAFRRGVDYNQIDDARRVTEYSPIIQSRLTLFYLFEPSIYKQAHCLALGLRVVERYDNRKKEVGFEFDYLTDANSIIKKPTQTDLFTAYGLNLTLLFLHTWNFIGEEENYNRIRGGLTLAVGGTYASGYLAGLVRTSYEWRLAKHFGVSLNIGYRPPATAFTLTQAVGTVTGFEYGLGISLLF